MQITDGVVDIETSVIKQGLVDPIPEVEEEHLIYYIRKEGSTIIAAYRLQNNQEIIMASFIL